MTDTEPAPPTPAARSIPDPLRSLQWLAILGVVALIVGRFLAPALPGAVVGVPRAVRAVEVLGDSLSLFFAVSAIAGLLAALLTIFATNIPPWIRLAALASALYAALGVVLSVVVIAFSADHGPGSYALPASAGAGLFAIVASVASRASRLTRLPALILGAVGAAGVVRALNGLLVTHAATWLSPSSLFAFGRVTATIAAILVALASALALIYIGTRAPPSQADEAPPGAPARPSLWSPVTIAVLILAVLCARQAAVGGAPEASALSVVLKRASDRFLVHPEPHLRAPIRLFLGFLTPLTAAALLLVRKVRTLTAALCLALVAADVTDSPLGALTLVLASLGVLLVARSGHVLWSALVARPPATPSRGA